MKRLNITESSIFVILCVLCFERQSFFYFYSVCTQYITSKAFAIQICLPVINIFGLTGKLTLAIICFLFVDSSMNGASAIRNIPFTL